MGRVFGRYQARSPTSDVTQVRVAPAVGVDRREPRPRVLVLEEAPLEAQAVGRGLEDLRAVGRSCGGGVRVLAEELVDCSKHVCKLHPL